MLNKYLVKLKNEFLKSEMCTYFLMERHLPSKSLGVFPWGNFLMFSFTSTCPRAMSVVYVAACKLLTREQTILSFFLFKVQWGPLVQLQAEHSPHSWSGPVWPSL
jgi:hypothetical protein